MRYILGGDIRNLLVISISMIVAFLAVSAGAESTSDKERCAPGYAYQKANAECVACNQPCNTGKPGICGRGIIDCRDGGPVCVSSVEPGERMELCNGEDDDCDGTVDEGFDKDSDKYTTCGGDCDDRDAFVHPDAAERCDGEDNNCNGLIDDGFNIGGTCTVGLGECVKEGKRRCNKSGLNAYCDAVPAEPGVEVCDAKDNDCNGLVDDGLGNIECGVGACLRKLPSCVAGAVPECMPGQPVTELCGDEIDNDCDGNVDEDFAELNRECFDGIGACRRTGKLVCDENALALVCSAKAGLPVPEICGNDVDDDCDSEVDKDVPGLSEACDNGLLGACFREGKRICNRTAGELVCSAPKVLPSPERCDNKDNNCDGIIDNDVAQTSPCGKGLCSGGARERLCEAGAWGEWGECSTKDKAVEEVCGNRMDDDCDGIVDDDAPGLGEKCDNGFLGACFREGILRCSGKDGKYACSAGPVDATAEVCNGIDDDCDGVVDEGVTNECGGCGDLPGQLGAACHVEGGDECATGIWACKKGDQRGMECALEPKKSEGKACGDDNNLCTEDYCVRGRCEHPPTRNDIECDDMNPCTVDDMCYRGECYGGGQEVCADGNICTADACDPVHGCYYTTLGGGVENVCGGCDILEVFPGERCALESKKGICRQGVFTCLENGEIDCIQNVFSREESCNGTDDDCNGEVDEGFGTTTCGVGKCAVTIDNCVDGEVKSCAPRDPLPETCANMGGDDDCNEVVDDVKNMGEECPVAVGTCIVPGSFKCIGDAAFPVCVVSNPSDAEDDDEDGVVNYCDHAGSIAGGVEIEVGDSFSLGSRPDMSSSSRLYDLSGTRAVMLPWNHVFDSVVIAPDSPDQAMVFVSGQSGEVGGLAYIRAKRVSSSGPLAFKECMAPQSVKPIKLLTVGDIADLIATTEKGYIRYPKIASQMPSQTGSSSRCLLKGAAITSDLKRVWTEGKKDVQCEVNSVYDINPLSKVPPMFVGVSSCTVSSGSMWKKDRRVLGFDIISEGSGGNLSLEYVPVISGNSDYEDVHTSVLTVGEARKLIIAATKDGERYFGECLEGGEGWNCWYDVVENAAGKIAFIGQLIPGGNPYLVTKKGDVFDILFDAAEKKVSLANAGSVMGKNEGSVLSLFEFPGQDDRLRTMLVGLNQSVAAATIKDLGNGKAAIRPEGGESFLPESSIDDVFLGEKLDMRRPHAFSLVPLKNYGGEDLFVSFDIVRGFKKIGEMGFFYQNANEKPHGSIVDVKFDGKGGRAKLMFEDPAGDHLNYRASIRADHGGSLDNWIDGFENGILRFSVKGDRLAVGLWPIRMEVTASDPGGLVAISRVVLGRDGRVEVISESSGRTE